MIEEWRDVEGYEGLYKVSNLGGVVSVKRNRWRLLKPGDRRGYRVVTLFRDNARTAAAVHRLVAAAFIPNPENYPQVNHLDGRRDNNILSNLEWTTGSLNCLHSIYVLNKPKLRGELHARALLVDDDIPWIRARKEDGCRSQDVAQAFGVSKKTIQAIWQRKLWSHVA